MTGQFTVVAATEPEPDHLHLVFALDDNSTELRFRDLRRFGSRGLHFRADRATLEADISPKSPSLGRSRSGVDPAEYVPRFNHRHHSHSQGDPARSEDCRRGR